MPGLVERAEALRALIETEADAGAAERRLPSPVVDALTEAGLMRMCVPEVYGGPEAAPAELIEAIEAVAIGDGGAGWCSMIASTTSSMSMFLPTATAGEIYGDASVVTGGVFAPNGEGTSVSVDGVDGFRVTGRWQWGSGTQHCQWILGGAMCDDGTFRLCWFPSSDVEFHDTWHTGGMRSSGSLDYSIDAAFVDLAHTMRPGVDEPTVDSPLSRFPNFTLLAAGVAAVGLGVGRHALDELAALAHGKYPQFSSQSLAESAFTQIELARAEASLRSARAFLLDEVSVVWERVERGEPVTIEQRTGVRLAAVNAATSAAAVADVVFTLAGGSAVYETSVLGRCARDAHVVTQHIQTAPKLLRKIGQLMLGQPADTTMF